MTLDLNKLPRILPQGTTRSKVTNRYALLTPDSFVPSFLPAPHWTGTRGIVQISPAMGAKFLQYEAHLTAESVGHAATAGIQRFVYVLEGQVHLHLGKGKKSMADVPTVAEAAKLLPADPLLSVWLNMENVRKAPQFKNAYKSPPRDDPQLTVLLGHYLDLLGRSPFVCAGIYREKDGFLATIRVPRGRDGMGADRLMHVPPAGMPGLS